jgi:hypothetical protein
MAVGDAYYSDAAKDVALDAMAAGPCKYVSAHTASPGSTGADECAGSTRQLLTYASAATGSKAITSGFAIPGIAITDTVQFLGLWSAATGGTYGGRIEVTPTGGTGGSTWSYEGAAGSIDLNSVTSA